MDIKNCWGDNIVLTIIAKFLYRCYLHIYGLEISYEAKIVKGLYIGHPYFITVNPKADLGDYCSIHRGVLIGQEDRGKRQGAPTIGNKV